MTGGEAKDVLYAPFSRLARAMSNPRRIELLELLAQAERSVEELSWASGIDFSNTSAQLQVLSRARLVESRREGKRVLYRLADQELAREPGRSGGKRGRALPERQCDPDCVHHGPMLPGGESCGRGAVKRLGGQAPRLRRPPGPGHRRRCLALACR